MAGSSLFYLKFIRAYVVFMSLWPRTIKILTQADLGRYNAASYLKIPAGKTFSYHGHSLVTFYVQFLCSDWLKFDRWVHAEIYAASWNLFNLVTEADRVLCQFVMFLSKLSFSTGCKKWNIAAVKSLLLFIGFFGKKCDAYQSWKSDFAWHRFCFSPCLIRKRV